MFGGGRSQKGSVVNVGDLPGSQQEAKSPPAGVRATIVAVKSVMTMEPRVAGRPIPLMTVPVCRRRNENEPKLAG